MNKIAVWGLGNHAIKNILPALKRTQNIDLAGIYTRNESLRNKYAKKFNCKTWLNHEEMLQDPDIDIIYCSTPPGLHHQMGIETLLAGKHFWCEKPVTMSLEEARSLVDLSNKRNLTLAEGFMYLYHPQIETLKNKIKEPFLENINYVDIIFTLPDSDNKSFRNKSELGGSSLYDIGCYNISLALEIFNQKDPKILYKKININNLFNIDTSGYASLQFGEDAVCNLFWGMGFGYRNEVNILSREGSLYTDKIFSKKEDYKPVLDLRNHYGEVVSHECGQANHFINMFSYFNSFIDDREKADFEKKRIIKLAETIEKFKVK